MKHYWQLLQTLGPRRVVRVLRSLLRYRRGLQYSELKTLVGGIAKSADPLSVREADALFRVVSGLDRRLYRQGSCLRVSLVLAEMLPAPVSFHLGAQKTGADFSAHAWVTWQDRVYSTETITHFTELRRFEL